MELRANLSNEYRLYNSICYTGKKEEENSGYYPTDADFMHIYNNKAQRQFLLDKLAQELHGSLLYHFLNQKHDTPVSPFWQYTILHYSEPLNTVHTESNRWVLNMEINLKIFKQIRLIQNHIKDCISLDGRIEVLCLGTKSVVGLPELRKEGIDINICCIESDENMLHELETTYANEPGIRKLVKGDFHHYCPDRKYDVIIYPCGKTWQETERVQTLLIKLRNYLKPEKGRVLAH